MLSTKQLAQKFFSSHFTTILNVLSQVIIWNSDFSLPLASFASILAALMRSRFISSAQGWGPGSSNQGRGAPPEPMGTEALNTPYLQRPTLWAGTRTLAEFFKGQRVRREVWRNKSSILFFWTALAHLQFIPEQPISKGIRSKSEDREFFF